MGVPKYLLKFGEKEYMDLFTNGEMYFSHAKRFAEIEDELVKGQGDKLEGKAVIKVTHVKASEYDNPENSFELKVGDGMITMMAEYVRNMPVFCLTGVYENDFQISIENDVLINSDILNTMVAHFPKADTVVVIKNPSKFIDKIEAEFTGKVVHGDVKYVTMNPVGIEWIRFVHENNVEKVEGGTKYSMTTDNAHRMLLCKDKYFIDEKEYRFILPDERIDNPKTYYFSKLANTEVMSFDDFRKRGFKR
jgi:hypothetical protein